MIGGGVMLAQFTNTLSPFVNRVVLDRTGLKAASISTSSGRPTSRDAARPPAGVPGAEIDADTLSIFTAVQEQLGLRLESTKGQVDVLVIDHIEPPTED